MTMRRLGWFVFFVLLLAESAVAQSVATGDLHATVKDPKGNLVVNATVTARDEAKGLERLGRGNGQGEYRVLALPPGTYTVTVEAPGFAKLTAGNMIVTVGQVVDLPLTLSVASGQEVVNVSSAAELVETTRSSTTDTVEQRRIDNLPINGRNYINFALTDSQVLRDNAPSIGAAPTSGLNISGQRARSNLVNVDGADATDNSTNGVRSTVSQEAVQEFQIIPNSYAAEYGRAAGGVVNIITRSGSNDFHGDVYGYLRNRNFQAVNPFSTVPNPAYTRVQAGAAFGGPIKKDKTYYYFSYEITRRHETGFSSIGQDNFGLVPFDTGLVGQPFGTVQLTPQQVAFLTDPATLQAEGASAAFAQAVGQYTGLAAASSGMAVNGKWPIGLGGLSGFPTTCPPPTSGCFVPASFQTLDAQKGNFPIFEGTSLYSLRLDHNVNDRNRLMLRVNVSPSTITGIEVNGENQTFGQNAFNRTSEQTYRDVAGEVQDTWTIGNNKVNEFRFQYARRGLLYNFSNAPGGTDPAVNIFGAAFFGREPYSYIQRTEERYQFADNFSWSIGKHDMKFGADFNYIPLTATFTVNYGGVYDFGSFSVAPFGFPSTFPSLSPVQAYGAGLPTDFIQGIGNPRDSFRNIPLGLFWQDSWRVFPRLTLNYGVRYDVEFPPKLAPPDPLALAGYNQLGLQKGIQTDTNNFQPRIGVAWDPRGNGKSVVRASYGIFYDHPLLGLYFLGDASDGSKSGQLAFGGTSGCAGAGNPNNLNAIPIFQGLVTTAPQCAPSPFPAVNSALGYLPNQQQFNAFLPNSIFVNQNYLNPATPLALAFQPFGYPQGKNFVYAYSQQANLTFEQDLGHGFAVSVAYNFNGGRHLNRPINANTVHGNLLVLNYYAAVAGGETPASPFTVSGCGVGPGGPFVPAALVNFFRPSGVNASIAGLILATQGAAGAQCVGLAQQLLAADGLNAKCDPATLANCVPFGDMDANFSNGSSVYHGFTTNLRKRFSQHYEFLASYTFSHAIDDSTDLQSPLAPQDSYYPQLERSNSLFDQRHRFVFSGVYQSGKLSGDSFTSKLFSNWTVAPIIEVASGRPFILITGDDANFQLASTAARPSEVPAGSPPSLCGTPTVASKYSKTGFFQEPCYLGLNPAALAAPSGLLLLDGNLSRNGGVKPYTLFNDIRVARRIYFGERINMDLIADMFNLANRFNIADVDQLWTAAGQPTAAYDPRQFQFALKVNW
ncbi:MAG: carboxypeptidase regulatory-like domain-containing protein [Terriglobales bacterium]